MPADVIDEIRSAVHIVEKVEEKWNGESATLDEQAFVDVGIPDQLRDLLWSAEAIRNRAALRRRSEADILSDFIGRSMDGPDTIHASSEFQDAVRDEQERAVDRAEKASADFVRDMHVTQKAITRAFASIPKPDNT